MMSLRAEINDALDDVIPPDPTLERDVTEYVLANAHERPVLNPRLHRSRWSYRLKGTATLVAAALIVLLVAGLVLGGRYLRDLRNAPSPAIQQGELERLEARPLLALPTMPADGVCPAGPLSTDYVGHPAIGDGVARSVQGRSDVYHTAWGVWNATFVIVDPSAKGLFLVRARDMQSRDAVFFAGNVSGVADAQMGRAVFAGKVGGTDKVNGQLVSLHSELVLNASSTSDFVKSEVPGWGAYIGYPNGTSGCIVFQVDHGQTTETFTRGF